MLLLPRSEIVDSLNPDADSLGGDVVDDQTETQKQFEIIAEQLSIQATILTYSSPACPS